MNPSLLCISLLATLAITACESKGDSSYIISEEDRLAKIKSTRASGVVLSPPTVLQGVYNFVIDSNNHFYYYSFQEKPSYRDIYDDDFEGEKAFFMHLEPNHLFAIPSGLEKEFFEENVLNLKNRWTYKHVYVGAAKDTIKNGFINYLKKVEADTSNHITLTIRPVIQEEREVLKAKTLGTFYNSSEVKWDSTNIEFK